MSDASPLVLATTEPTRPGAVEGREKDATRVARGVCVGRFILIEEVGAGGGGQVWRAFDPELDRTIAIKLLHSQAGGIVTEAQALAKLEHPNVARIHDVGTVRLDRPYTFLAVEFVEGPTLAEYCQRLRDEGGQARGIVRTFIALGHGLAAVHDAGLVHRDFKPTNALINPEGRPMLVDFGLAQPELSGATGEQAVAGTLAYMPPEQHQGMAVSAAGDTYAFCAALWEALSGTLPFSGASPAELLEAKRAGVANGSAPVGIPRRIARVLARGLQPNPAQRFTDTRTLLQLLERANAPRPWPGVLLVGVVVGAAVVGVAVRDQSEPCQEGIGGIWTDARRAAVEGSMLDVGVPYGRHVTRNTIAALDRWSETWTSSRQATCKAAQVHGGAGGETYALQTACYDRALSRFDAVAEMLENSDVASIEGANDLLTELRSPAKCEDGPALRASGSVDVPRVDDTSAKEARRLLDAVDVNRAAGRLDEAGRLLMQLRGGPELNPRLLASIELAAGALALAREDHEAAEIFFRKGLGLALEAADWSQVHGATVALIDLVGSHVGRTQEALRYREFAEGLIEGDSRAQVDTLLALGGVYRRADQHDEASRSYEAALALQVERYGENSLEAAAVYSELGILLAKSEPQRGLELAQRTYDIRKERLGIGHPEVTTAMVRLAWSLAAVGRHPDQLALLKRALEATRWAPGTAQEAEVAHALGGALVLLERCDEAEPHVLRAVELGGGQGGEVDLRLATYLFHLGGLYECQGRHGEAQAKLERVLEVRTKILGSEHTDVADTLQLLARTHFNRAQWDPAVELQRQALEIRVQALGDEHIDVATSRVGLGNTLRALGKFEEAAELLGAAVRTFDASVDEEHPGAGFARATLADTLLDLGRIDEAVELARLAWKHLCVDEGVPASQRGYASFVLALALWETGEEANRREALNYAKVAISNLEEAGAADRVAAVRAWLAEAPP